MKILCSVPVSLYSVFLSCSTVNVFFLLSFDSDEWTRMDVRSYVPVICILRIVCLLLFCRFHFCLGQKDI